MHYQGVAFDYDGTLASNGHVAPATLSALNALRASGRRLILVTGRELDDLRSIFPGLDVFDRVVLENGAVLYRPRTNEQELLAKPPPPAFCTLLVESGITPLSIGRVIVATRSPNEGLVLDAIHRLGLELQVIFNKGAVMVLPSGVNKASGLVAALEELNLSADNVVGCGDAENDHSLLEACGCAVAVSNALPSLKKIADLVTDFANGAGVEELIGRLITSDLSMVVTRRPKTDSAPPNRAPAQRP